MNSSVERASWRNQSDEHTPQDRDGPSRTPRNENDLVNDEQKYKPMPDTPEIEKPRPEAQKRCKKPPLIDVNALDARQQKTIPNIATAGACVANARRRSGRASCAR